jgi:formylglycine-generating enzyme required for sulfatase activity
MKRFLLTALFVLIGTLAFAQERIAVFPFEDRNNVYTKDELDSFYVEFSNEFANKTDDRRFTVLARDDLEKIINMETKFQLSDYSSKEKTAELNRVLNAQQVLYCLILKVGNEIRITVSRYTFPELSVLRGGKTISVTNKNQLFGKIPELVQAMVTEIAGGGTPAQTPIPPNFVRIEGGTFTMGSPSNEPGRDNDEVQHRVTVSSFFMGKYQVTQAEYEAVMGTNPSYFKGSNLPVEKVSWYDAVEFCNRLSLKEGLTPAYTIDKSRSDPNNINSEDDIRWLITWNPNTNGYRLPTEGEWEYACRAGTTTPFYTGNSITTNNANYNGNYPYNNNLKGIYREKTTPVGSFVPNPWGLYDMHGNVSEWCWDWYGDYTSSSQSDPKGALSGIWRVVRGGDWNGSADFSRSGSRSYNAPFVRIFKYYGFRLVRPINN